MTRRVLSAIGLISLLIVSVARVYAADEPPKTIKEVMANHKKDQLRQQIGDEIKATSPDWAALQKKTKTYADATAKLGSFDPPKGDKDSYKKLAASFAESAKEIDKAVQAKDAKAAMAAFQKSGMACSACHQAHRP